MTSQRIQRSVPLYWFLIFATLFSLQVIPRFSQDSPAGDEVNDIVDGFYYWKGDVISAAEHPPLAKALQAVPLLTMGLKSKSGLNFSGYSVRDAYFLSVLNRDHFDEIVKGSRSVSWLFGLLLGAILFYIARSHSLVFCATAMVLWVFEPTLLAFSGFALSDIPMTFFFFVATWQFHELLSTKSTVHMFVVGLLTGMAITVKFTALLLVPLFFILEIVHWVQPMPERQSMTILKRWGIGFVAACAWIFILYLPGTLAMPEHPWPFSLFINGLRTVSHSFEFAFYFKGILAHRTYWDYYLTAFLLKSPLPFLLLLAAGLGLGLTGIKKIPAWQWVPVVLFFLVFLSFYDIGLRMILPVYPFCILMAAHGGEWLAVTVGEKKKYVAVLWGLLLFLQVVSVVSRFPYQVGYFNELIPTERRLYWLGDSNLDFGQDTKRLAEAVKARGWDHIKLAYFGSVDPGIYGMNWSYWTRKDLQGPQPGWVYVINDEFIQLAPAYYADAANIDQSWILKVKPSGHIADTWSYFEVPGKVQSDHSPVIASTGTFLDDLHHSQQK